MLNNESSWNDRPHSKFETLLLLETDFAVADIQAPEIV